MTDLHSIMPLLATIFVASIAGSGHCVGMCGPLMLLAVNRSAESNAKPLRAEALYHFGRLLGYAVLGLVAGSVGWMLESGGQLAGLQKLAAYVSGLAMILFGGYSLWALYRHGSIPHLGTAAVGKYLKPFIKRNQRLPQAVRPLGIGLITACLPCGWLYAFLLLAVATRGPWTGSLVMLAFWLGTIPALSLTGLASRLFPQKWNLLGNTLIAGLLIVSGIFTLSVRAHADMGDLHQNANGASAVELLNGIHDQPRPCCLPSKPDSPAD